MSRTMQSRNTGNRRKALVHMAAIAAVIGMAAPSTSEAQQAIGVPFAGRNHLSFSVTELSRDGIGQDRTAVFGGMYGRRLNGDDAPVQYSVVLRSAMRALDLSNSGIVDAGITVAATRRIAGGLSATGAAGASAIVWGKDHDGGNVEHGRIVARVPLSAGLAYDVRLGAVTIAPFFTLTGAYSRELEYVDGARVDRYTGWRYANASGLSVRFRDVVLTLTEINRERDMPKSDRMLFTAGISW
jgi:hypothetical protein